ANLLQPLTAEAVTRGRVHQLDTNIPAYSSGNLYYHGGPIMAQTTHIFVIFWQPPGSYVSANYHSLIFRYFNDVGGSLLYHNTTQYKSAKGVVSRGSRLTGYWIDTAPYPSQHLNDQQIRAEVQHAMQVNSWSPHLYRAFFVFTAKGVTICY